MNIDEAWDRAIEAVGDTNKPIEESRLKLARAGHPNARHIVADELAGCECPGCGPFEECAGATAEDFARRGALRALAALLGIEPLV